MGCSFYFSGCLKDHKAQEEVIELAAQFAENLGFMILPDSSKKYLTKIRLDTNLLEDGSYTQDSCIIDPACPFDFFGISFLGNPLLHEPYGVPHQFVFHRCQPGTPAYIERREGMIVSLSLEPIKSYSLDPLEQYSPSEYNHTEIYEGPLLYVRSGGELRAGGGGSYALLLNLIKLRWMPDLIMSDDYGNCDRMEYFIHYNDLVDEFSSKSLSFEDCWEIIDVLW